VTPVRGFCCAKPILAAEIRGSVMKAFAVFMGACVVSSLILSSAFAASPLPAGKPAGVKQAQLGTDTLVPLVAGGALVAGLAIVASQHSDTPAGVISTTTGTSP
jgi:hypothetical protein